MAKDLNKMTTDELGQLFPIKMKSTNNNKLDWTSTDRIADFSENTTVSIAIDGNIPVDLEMIYLVSIPMFYYQEFELPKQYSGFTFIYSSTGTSIDDPLETGGDIIRSNKFNSITLQVIPEGETKTITGIMTFNTDDLIQIYAGKDIIPYTFEDVFVYAPKFWERISVILNS